MHFNFAVDLQIHFSRHFNFAVKLSKSYGLQVADIGFFIPGNRRERF